MYDQFFTRLISRKRQELSNVSSKEFVNIGNLQDQLRKIDAELDNQREKLTQANKPSEKKSINENIEALEEMRRKLDKEISLKVSRVKIYDDDILVDLKKLYFSLKQHPDVNQIVIDESAMTIIITTNNLLARKTYIGSYIIKINFNAKEVFITRYDGNSYDGGFPHPFVSGGRVCFGNKGKEVYKALTQGGFYSIAIICIELLKYTSSGAHPFISWQDFRDWVVKYVPQR